MRAASTLAFALGALLAPQALAGVYVTSPVAGSGCTAGAPCTVNWNDDGKSPTLAEVGICEIGLWVGNPQQQTEIQVIQPAYDVSRFASTVFLPNAQAGPNFDKYFVRFTCSNLKDAAGNPYESFSAMFAITGMTGQFDPSVSAQIAGITSAAGGAAPAPAAATPPAAPAVTTPAAGATTTASPAAATGASSQSGSSSASGTKASTSAKPTAAPNGAVKLGNVGAAGAIGTAFALLFSLVL